MDMQFQGPCIPRVIAESERPSVWDRMRTLLFPKPSSNRHLDAKVSIIVTARNYGRFLREALESAVSQTVPCEVIYSDDCSTDHSLDVARSFEDRGVLVLSSSGHDGVVAARRRGVSAATGEYLVHLDGDDILPPDFVARHLDAMGPGVPFVYGPVDYFGVGPRVGKARSEAPEWPAHIWRQNFVNTSAMYARWAYEASGGWRELIGTMWDWDLALRAGRFGTPRPSEACLRYRQHEESWSHSYKYLTGNYRGYIMSRIRRENARVSIGTVFSGRVVGLFDDWITAVADEAKRFVHPPELVILDNSAVGDEVRRVADRHAGAFGSIRIVPHARRWPWTTDREYRDGVARFMAESCNRLRDLMTGDIHWLIEDDILITKFSGEMLFEKITQGVEIINAVAGLYRNRHRTDRYVGGWRRNGRYEEIREPPNAIVDVDFTGTGCLMFWPHMCPDVWESHHEGIPAHDWNWGFRLKEMGGRLQVMPSVRCWHAIDEQCFTER